MEVLNENVYNVFKGENHICHHTYPLDISNATGALVQGNDNNFRLLNHFHSKYTQGL